jgi:head-tail adaptor
MRAGACNKWVQLAKGPQVAGGPFAPLSPEGSWAAIEPLAPGGADDRSLTHIVRMRYHPEVTFDTRVAYADARKNRTRYLFVRGVQTVNEAGDEMVLLAEEVEP